MIWFDRKLWKVMMWGIGLRFYEIRRKIRECPAWLSWIPLMCSKGLTWLLKSYLWFIDKVCFLNSHVCHVIESHLFELFDLTCWMFKKLILYFLSVRKSEWNLTVDLISSTFKKLISTFLSVITQIFLLKGMSKLVS